MRTDGGQAKSAASRATERTLAWIERHIARQGLRVGDALPGEQEIGRRVGVSRSSVREALTALKALGILRSRRRGGIRLLRDPVLLELRHFFVERFESRERHADALEFRAALEWGLGPLMLARVGERTLGALRRIVAEVARAGPGLAEVDAAEIRFHAALTAACGNRLASLFSHLYVPIFRHEEQKAGRYGSTRKEIDTWVEEHRGMVEALANRDPKRFLSCLKRHTHAYMRFGRRKA